MSPELRETSQGRLHWQNVKSLDLAGTLCWPAKWAVPHLYLMTAMLSDCSRQRLNGKETKAPSPSVTASSVAVSTGHCRANCQWVAPLPKHSDCAGCTPPNNSV